MVTQLFEIACRSQSISCISKFLEYGVPFDIIHHQLIACAEEGRFETFSVLIKHPGIDPHFRYPDVANQDNLRMGDPTDVPVVNCPIIAAVVNCRTVMLSILLAIDGIDVNAKDGDGKSPRMTALCRRNTEIVRLLLRDPAVDVNARDADGATALIVAAGSGQNDIV
jgi:hypothetical protein